MSISDLCRHWRHSYSRSPPARRHCLLCVSHQLNDRVLLNSRRKVLKKKISAQQKAKGHGNTSTTSVSVGEEHAGRTLGENEEGGKEKNSSTRRLFELEQVVLESIWRLVSGARHGQLVRGKRSFLIVISLAFQIVLVRRVKATATSVPRVTMLRMQRAL